MCHLAVQRGTMDAGLDKAMIVIKLALLGLEQTFQPPNRMERKVYLGLF